MLFQNICNRMLEYGDVAQQEVKLWASNACEEQIVIVIEINKAKARIYIHLRHKLLQFAQAIMNTRIYKFDCLPVHANYFICAAVMVAHPRHDLRHSTMLRVIFGKRANIVSTGLELQFSLLNIFRLCTELYSER